MESNWAAEHLQVIRTLMERTAVYRRTLAPIMLAIGILGVSAGLLGWFLSIEGARNFAAYWSSVSLVCLAFAFLLARRQALREREPFWSPPTRRVTRALVPPLFAGWTTVVAMFLPQWQLPRQGWWLVALWMILYGCAIHAAGFFMPRGIKLFGWLFILAGGGLFLALSTIDEPSSMHYGHFVMGAVFGGAHLAYGIYLYLTERGKNAA
jgi:hypothetical protein